MTLCCKPINFDSSVTSRSCPYTTLPPQLSHLQQSKEGSVEETGQEVLLEGKEGKVYKTLVALSLYHQGGTLIETHLTRSIQIQAPSAKALGAINPLLVLFLLHPAQEDLLTASSARDQIRVLTKDFLPPSALLPTIHLFLSSSCSEKIAIRKWLVTC